MLAHTWFTDFSSSFSVDLTTLISCLNSFVRLEICECRLEKLSSIRDSMAINLSRSISVEISESVSWFLPFLCSSVCFVSELACRRSLNLTIVPSALR